MPLTSLATSFKAQLDAANPQVLADMLRQAKIGTVLRGLSVSLRFLKPSAILVVPYVNATVQSTQLPEGAKCESIITAYARSGAGTLGPLTVSASQTPAAGSVGISASGDLIFNAADAWTSVDVSYEVAKGDVIELTLPVVPATGVCALPVATGQPAAPGAIVLMEAEALTGTSATKKVVVPSAAAAPAAGNAGFNFAKTSVFFAIADGVTTARVKLAVPPGTDLNALLEASSNFL